MRILLLLLVVAACTSPGRAGGGPEPRQQERWRTNWRAFWEAVEPHARAGAIESNRDSHEFNRVFGGEVEWTGTLRSFRSHEGFVSVEIDMPPVMVPLSDGSSVEVRELSLSCSMRDAGCAGWAQELVGRRVRFRTTLENRTRGYRPVVRAESTGNRRWIQIEAHGVELVGFAAP